MMDTAAYQAVEQCVGRTVITIGEVEPGNSRTHHSYLLFKRPAIVVDDMKNQVRTVAHDASARTVEQIFPLAAPKVQIDNPILINGNSVSNSRISPTKYSHVKKGALLDFAGMYK